MAGPTTGPVSVVTWRSESVGALLPVDRLYSVGVVVKDLGAATRRYAEIFGIDRWEVRRFGPERLTDVLAHGRPVTPGFRTATGTTRVPPPSGHPLAGPLSVPVTFELVQPLAGESPFQEFRFVRGQGVSHLALAVQDEAAFEATRRRLAERGIPIAASMTVDGRLRRHFIDTRKTLGGYLVEVRVPLGSTAASGPDLLDLAPDEVWDHSGAYTRPDGVGPLPVSGVSHFGVVVHDLMESLRRYHEILGVERWAIRDWRTEPGLLENAFYRGEPVEHEYFTGLTPFQDFGFEVIQPTFGPSHYNREFRDRYGEGVHHMLLHIETDPEAWDRTRRWLASIGVPLAMGADLMGGATAFCYHDTWAALGGYIVEGVLRRERPDPELAAPEYHIDFAAVTASL